jgi:hypothetical protein
MNVDEQTKQVLSQMQAYVEASTRILADQETKKASFNSAAEKALNKLAAAGVVDPNMVTKIANQISTKPELVFDYLVKLASKVTVPSLGNPTPAVVKTASTGRKRSAADEVFETKMLS